MARRMAACVDDANYFFNAIESHTTNSKLVVPATAYCMVGLLMALAPWTLGAMTSSAGVFIALMKAMQDVGNEAEDLFSSLIDAQLSISSLLKVSMYMNLETGTLSPA